MSEYKSCCPKCRCDFFYQLGYQKPMESEFILDWNEEYGNTQICPDCFEEQIFFVMVDIESKNGTVILLASDYEKYNLENQIIFEGSFKQCVNYKKESKIYKSKRIILIEKIKESTWIEWINELQLLNEKKYSFRVIL